MSATDFMVDATTRNAVYVQRLASGEVKKATRFIDELQTELNRIIGVGDFTQARQSQMISTATTTSRAFLTEMSQQVTESAISTGTYTSGFTKRLLDKASNQQFELPIRTATEQAVLNTAMQVKPGSKALTINEATTQFTDAKTAEITRAMRDGFATGLTKDQIIDEITGVMSLARQQTDALVRTTTNASANMGRLETLQENKAFLEGYEWVAKLDARTTLVCAGRDGQIYKFGTGSPMPPAHWNCRSQIVAAIIPKYQDKGLKGERNAENGEVTANTTYGAWLKKQPAAFQNEALGPERGSLFRNGGLKIDRFTDTTGKTYTIDQLRTLEPQAFERAGLAL